jgi:hypothetical protein
MHVYVCRYVYMCMYVGTHAFVCMYTLHVVDKTYLRFNVRVYLYVNML